MAFEILFYFHPKQEDGKYNTEETQTFSKTIGRRKTEDVPLERVAAAIMGEMARRDILIAKVELFEFAKREIAFKETKGGFVIKNRKFQFDQLQGELISQEIESKPEGKTETPIRFNEPTVLKPSLNVPLRQEVYRPSREDAAILARQGIPLTMNKPYPIFKEVIRRSTEPMY